MKRLLTLTLACAALSWAQVQYTTIQDVMRGGSGRPMEGTLTATWQAFSTPTGIVPAGRKTVALQDGRFTLTLAATDTAANAYYVVNVIHQGVTDAFTWQVPTMTGIAKLQDLTIGVNGAAPLPQGGSSGAGAAPPVSYTAAGSFDGYSAGKIVAGLGDTAIYGQGTAWTQSMAGWWLQTSGTSKVYYKVLAVDDQAQTLTTYDPIETDLSAGGEYVLTQPLIVPASTHLLGASPNLDATCKDAQGEPQDLNVAATLVQPNGDTEVVFLAAWAGRCTLRR